LKCRQSGGFLSATSERDISFKNAADSPRNGGLTLTRSEIKLHISRREGCVLLPPGAKPRKIDRALKLCGPKRFAAVSCTRFSEGALPTRRREREDQAATRLANADPFTFIAPVEQCGIVAGSPITTVIATVIVGGDVLPSILTTDHGDNGEQSPPSLEKVQTRAIRLILNRSKSYQIASSSSNLTSFSIINSNYHKDLLIISTPNRF